MVINRVFYILAYNWFLRLIVIRIDFFIKWLHCNYRGALTKSTALALIDAFANRRGSVFQVAQRCKIIDCGVLRGYAQLLLGL